MAAAIAAWLLGAKAALRGAAELSLLKSAEDWLKGAGADIRNQRFAPIADQAMATWRFLRQNSSVELGRIELAGSKNQRRVTLDVTVDGVAGAALEKFRSQPGGGWTLRRDHISNNLTADLIAAAERLSKPTALR